MFGRDREFNTGKVVLGLGTPDHGDGGENDSQVLASGEGRGAGFEERGEPGEEPGDLECSLRLQMSLDFA